MDGLGDHSMVLVTTPTSPRNLVVIVTWVDVFKMYLSFIYRRIKKGEDQRVKNVTLKL